MVKNVAGIVIVRFIADVPRREEVSELKGCYCTCNGDFRGLDLLSTDVIQSSTIHCSTDRERILRVCFVGVRFT